MEKDFLEESVTSGSGTSSWSSIAGILNNSQLYAFNRLWKPNLRFSASNIGLIYKPEEALQMVTSVVTMHTLVLVPW